eukprot:m.54095 g.54095  ORF g.54095 m.54095 type:complete len:519 (+) comp48693_c0_seq1:73-1629(+)
MLTRRLLLIGLAVLAATLLFSTVHLQANPATPRPAQAFLDKLALLRHNQSTQHARGPQGVRRERLNVSELDLQRILGGRAAQHCTNLPQLALKVFIYPLPSRFNTDLLAKYENRWDACNRFMFRAENTLHHLLNSSYVRTTSLADADYFFVPVYLACATTHEGWKAGVSLLIDAWHILSTQYADTFRVRIRHHLWPVTRTLGLYELAVGDVFCHERGLSNCGGLLSANPQALQDVQQGILLVHFAPSAESALWAGYEYFDANKDVSIPYDLGTQLEAFVGLQQKLARWPAVLAQTAFQHQSLSPTTPVCGQSAVQSSASLACSDPGANTHVAAFRGKILDTKWAGHVLEPKQFSEPFAQPRRVLLELFGQSQRVLVSKFEVGTWQEVPDVAPRASWLDELASSSFYLAPAGSGVQTTRFFECLFAGRIPVLFSSLWLLPFQRLIDYSLFTVSVPLAAMAQLEQILDAVPLEQVFAKQLWTQVAWALLSYNHDLRKLHQTCDAFELLLFDLTSRLVQSE